MPSPDPGEPRPSLVEENMRLREELEAANQYRSKLKEDLEHALLATKNAQQELQDFVYAASHDLKEPLRSITSYTQLLQRHGSDPHQTAEYARFIVEGVNSATKLLEQLLRLSRAGSNPRRTSLNLAVPVQTALFRLQPLIKELNAEVACGALHEFSVDEAQFTQVFELVLDNSLKYRGSAAPRIQISSEETEDGLLVTISDNGAGIPMEFCEQVFAPFKRLHGREVPGAGLGLAICRKIVAAHDGKIWVESNDPCGSTLKISLPY